MEGLLDGRLTLLPGCDRDARHQHSHAPGWGGMRRRGTEEERRTGQQPDCPLGIIVHMRRAGGMLQRRIAE